jgi:ankyrin repeat protein
VQLLLEKGAAIDAADNNGRTPLLWATKNRHEAMAQLLLDNGAAIDAAHNNGRTLLLLSSANAQETANAADLQATGGSGGNHSLQDLSNAINAACAAE